MSEATSFNCIILHLMTYFPLPLPVIVLDYICCHLGCKKYVNILKRRWWLRQFKQMFTAGWMGVIVQGSKLNCSSLSQNLSQNARSAAWLIGLSLIVMPMKYLSFDSNIKIKHFSTLYFESTLIKIHINATKGTSITK